MTAANGFVNLHNDNLYTSNRVKEKEKKSSLVLKFYCVGMKTRNHTVSTLKQEKASEPNSLLIHLSINNK